MKSTKKNVLQYSITFLALCIFQLVIIRGVITSKAAKTVIPELTVDGADFTPILSLVFAGVQSLAFLLSEISAVIWGIFVPFIVMLIVRRFSEKSISNEEKRVNRRITLIISFIVLLIGCAFSAFKLIGDVCLMFIPVPLISWIVYHFKKNKISDLEGPVFGDNYED